MRWINTKPSPGLQLTLMLAPFVLLVISYGLGSAARLADNPSDKLLPALASLTDAVNRMAFTPDVRTGDYLMWSDTAASLSRLLWALGISTAIALVLGMVVGMFPYARAFLAPFIATVSMVPPLALLPVLFIVLGLGETAKITLIIIGVAPPMIRDLALKVAELPREQIIKAETLGASSWQIALRVVLPQTLPRLFTCLRLQLGPAWLFLIAAEAIASEDGLGYRIFLVRRYLAMDVLLTYVMWIPLLAFLLDWLLSWLSRRLYPWAEAA